LLSILGIDLELIVSLQKIHLRRLLQLFYAPKNLRTSKLREDIRRDISKAAGEESDGGDFHTPFWADAKEHVLGHADLRALSIGRIADAKGRARLYPLLTDGFLEWWNDKRRWRNEPLELLPTPPRAQLLLPEIGATVKVENLMGLESGPDFHRLVYPYFAEVPVLPTEAVRLALWCLRETLLQHDISNMRVLDVLRGGSFGTLDVALVGDEREVFVRRYRELLDDWDELRKDY
jgi:hypothetical protein